MSAALLEAHYIVRSAAEPWTAGDSVKAGINRAARVLGLSYRRARTFWYCGKCLVLAEEMDRLRRAHHELLVRKAGRSVDEVAIVLAKLDQSLDRTNDRLRAELVQRLGGHYGQNAPEGGGAGASLACGGSGQDSGFAGPPLVAVGSRGKA